AVTWTGARVFDSRKVLPLYLVAGPVLWVIVSHLPSFVGEIELRSLLASGIIATYTWLTAYEFWRGRGEPLVSRWPAIFMLFAHGALFLLRTPLAAVLPWSPAEPVFQSVWLTALSFEALLFTISIAFILLAMAKERTELRHRTAARTDQLTGIANRRGFLEQSAILKRRALDAQPVAVLLFDLDHFKLVNDQFGHAIGDRTLQIFADTAKANLGSAGLVGRWGGDEFAAVLCGTTRDHAATLAERIQVGFEKATADIQGRPVKATVSSGMVFSASGLLDLPALLAQADAALYRAKQNGRNRLEIETRDASAAAATGDEGRPAARLRLLRRQ